MITVNEILNQQELSKQDIIRLLSITDKGDQELLIKKAYSIKESTIGKRVFLRGLIEFSNYCRKNCYYCGIRRENSKASRYSMTDEEILEVVDFAQRKQLTGIVLQSGELSSVDFIKRITALITKIKKATNPEFRITLSLGEQSLETYQRWFDAGAQRYLLRIETSSEDLYKKIHPVDDLHSFKVRLKCIENIQKAGYMTGTGVMIGLPFQTIENLTDDLLFIKERDIDMVGMGPYLEHADTPLYNHKDLLMPAMERFNLSIRMIAVLRIMMPDINIASTTALQSIVPLGREAGLKAGANVMMPNLTPLKYRSSYLLYDNKACINEDTDDCLNFLEKRIRMIGEEIAYNDYGDSIHFIKRK
ncbi:[FeFe] hydrogenase H-cluster radical SAM maturase HydE [uncultured Bacteroides sp.]|uniref:[FeFe] hydrogenase H-cluster radical SAM maturase HydE n=1 Tax=uncultured Bacteroides sp. TaxID=162156 RepID=UPI002AABA561|nr:[FeFe] hydrogenase H-cluster radical SAM maturase HydE [uncultured Bacteroides sp.]